MKESFGTSRFGLSASPPCWQCKSSDPRFRTAEPTADHRPVGNQSTNNGMAKCRELLNKGLLQDIFREQMWVLSEVREKVCDFQKLPLDKSHFITEVCKINGNGTTLENIHRAAKAEFLEKGYKDASLRNIVKSVGMTTGAFYGYYKSKEELFESIVGEHYEYIRNRFIKAQQEFAELPAAQQPEVMSDISGICMYDILYYAYEHLEECKLILCCSEGTKFAGLIDEMVEIEVDGTHAYQDVLRQLGRPSPHIDPSLEHILITGMFHTFFELIIHEMPLKDAENYVREMRAFYTAGWMKIMGQ